MPARFFLPIALLFLASCAAAPERPEDGKVIPIKKFLADMHDRPYECFEYKQKKDACTAVAKRTVSGNVLTMEVEVMEYLPGGGNAKAKITVDFEIRKMGFCGSMANAELEVESNIIPEPYLRQVKRAILRRMSRDKFMCNEYVIDA